jgi:hypothetical protein
VIALVGIAAPGVAEAYRVTGEPKACAVKQLRLGLLAVSGHPANHTYRVSYTNVSATRCTLKGFTELEFRDARGGLLGRAGHDARTASTGKVTLGTGAVASSTFTLRGLATGRCRAVASDRVVLHPPVRGKSIRTRALPFAAAVCSGPEGGAVIEPITADGPPASAPAGRTTRTP